jgi:hypothetical protein
MTFHPKALLVTAAFFAALALAIDFRLGLMSGLVAGVAYVAIEVLGTGGFGAGAFRGGR